MTSADNHGDFGDLIACVGCWGEPDKAWLGPDGLWIYLCDGCHAKRRPTLGISAPLYQEDTNLGGE